MSPAIILCITFSDWCWWISLWANWLGLDYMGVYALRHGHKSGAKGCVLRIKKGKLIPLDY